MNSPGIGLDQILMRLAALENIVNGLVKAAGGLSLPAPRVPLAPRVPVGVQGVRIGTRHTPPRPRGPKPRGDIDEALWDRRDMLEALSQRDIQMLYRLLNAHGVSQRRIAGLTAQAQSEVSEILSGRKVTSYEVLLRICDGLSIPRGRMGLSYDEDTLAFLRKQGDASPSS